MSATLTMMGQLVRRAENTGQRLDRRRLLSDESWDRFIHVECRSLTTPSAKPKKASMASHKTKHRKRSALPATAASAARPPER